MVVESLGWKIDNCGARGDGGGRAVQGGVLYKLGRWVPADRAIIFRFRESALDSNGVRHLPRCWDSRTSRADRGRVPNRGDSDLDRGLVMVRGVMPI